MSSALISMVIVPALTRTETILRAWIGPKAIFRPTTMMTPLLLARRCTVTGEVAGMGGGPACRAPRGPLHKRDDRWCPVSSEESTVPIRGKTVDNGVALLEGRVACSRQKTSGIGVITMSSTRTVTR